MQFGGKDSTRVLSLILIRLDSFGYLGPIVGHPVILAVTRVRFSIRSGQVAEVGLSITGQASDVLYLIDGSHLFLLELVGKDYYDLLDFILDKGKGRDYFFLFGEGREDYVDSADLFVYTFNLFLIGRVVDIA